MNKTFLYRYFKIGGIPKKLRPVLEAEGIVAADEGIGGWIFLRDFRAPGKRFLHRVTGFSGFLVITHRRILAYAYWKPVINVPVDDPRVSGIKSVLLDSEHLELTLESSIFHADWQGRIVLRLNTARAPSFHSAITGIQ